ncbi:hypothetical protein BT96DRAFT_371783 [Gymnopus androsaceus JB14]|uniref:Lysine-specific metallo-endopeptidase domain-containing protein n=1 Tax=Gymnopus androsaceus JB14 TaxID=1447944 RepID=A0A6A4IK72_9AGAR|nr:hypothetical protein BT96DRAFT_371783 [Gymnopus androsaceus JB14]
MRLPFPSFVLSLALILLPAWAAPAGASAAAGKDLVAKLVTIDANCQPHRPKLQKSLEDMYTLALKAQEMEEKDVAFTNYFVEGNHVKPFDKTKMFTKDPEHIQDSKMVPKMFESIVTGGGKGTKFHAFCPTVEQEPDCELEEATFAFVDSRLPTAEPKIAFCPSFFENDPETKDDLDSKKFTANLDHWCKQADHVFGDMITAGHTVLHEVTHLAFILRHAVEAAVDGLSKEVAEQMAGTLDIYGSPDEKDGNEATYGWHAASASRALKRRWVAYLAHSKRSIKKRETLKPPPHGSIDDAESYAAAATGQKHCSMTMTILSCTAILTPFFFRILLLETLW